jgi:hypothetical protein
MKCSRLPTWPRSSVRWTAGSRRSGSILTCCLVWLVLSGAGAAAAQPLVLVHHDAQPDISGFLQPYLEALAEVYGPAGLTVRAAWVQWPTGADAATGGPELDPACGSRLQRPLLALQEADGTVLAAMDRDSLNLYMVYRICQQRLLGRRHATYFDHAADVLAMQAQGGTEAVALDNGRPVALSTLLEDHAGGLLLLPPGCSECLLGKYAASLTDHLQDWPDQPALVFEPEAGVMLEEFSWRGAAHLVPLDAAARLLTLRQAGTYAPALITWDAQSGVQASALRGKEGS